MVRARSLHRRPHRTLLRAALCRHGLADCHAEGFSIVGWRKPQHRSDAGDEAPSHRRGRRALAHLFFQHLQSGAPQGEGDAGGDAEEILEEPARGVAHSGADRQCRGSRARDGCGTTDPTARLSRPVAGRVGRGEDARRRQPNGCRRGARAANFSLPALPAAWPRHPGRVR